MDMEFEKGFFAELLEMFESDEISARMETIEGKPTAVLEYDGENEPEDINISLEHFREDTTEVNILVSVFTGLEPEKADGICKLLPYMNRYLGFGALGILPNDSGYLYLDYSYEIDEGLDMDTIMKMLLAVLTIVTSTAEQAIELLTPYIKGEATVESLMNEESCLTE